MHLISRGLIYSRIIQLVARNNASKRSQIRFNSSLNETPKPTIQSTQPKSSSNRNKLFLIFGGGILSYFVVSYYVSNQKPSTNSPQALKYRPENIQKISKFIDRGVENPGNVRIILYQYATCPFCCKVRAYLDYFGYKYEIVEVNSIWRNELKWSSYKKVPILAVKPVDSQEFIQINDSSVIISALETYRQHQDLSLKEILNYYQSIESLDKDGKPSVEIPNKYFIMKLTDNTIDSATVNDMRDEREWRSWVDNKFIHVISPNIYRTLSESLQSFKWFNEAGQWEQIFNTFERLTVIYTGALAMYFVGERLRKRHNLKEDVRESMYDLANEWKSAIGSQTFRGGAKPNLADLALFGALNSFRGCEAFNDLMAHVNIRQWFSKCDEFVQKSKGKELLKAQASKDNLKQIDTIKKKKFGLF